MVIERKQSNFASVKTTIALVGNPNTGKSSLFTRITGVRTAVGNLAGITVEACLAKGVVEGAVEWTFMDLPGIYNLHAQTDDGRVTENALLNPNWENKPDVVWLIADRATLQGQLFLALQIRELEIPTLLLLNRMDFEPEDPLLCETLEAGLGLPVREIHALNDDPKKWAKDFEPLHHLPPSCSVLRDVPPSIKKSLAILNASMPYGTLGYLCHLARMNNAPNWLNTQEKAAWEEAREASTQSPAGLQLEEAGGRMKIVRDLLKQAGKPVKEREILQRNALKNQQKIDAVLTHPIWGNLISAALFFGMFQAIYSWATYPMDLIDGAFTSAISFLEKVMPSAWYTSLLLDGILSGIAGILVFVPQIAILFGFTAFLEHSGYMARLGYLSDRFFRRLGLTGRSSISLVGGLACAVPAIMAARTISDRRARLLTILVTPMMTCSARLPVYAFLIAFAVPDEKILGWFNLQGLFLYALYVIGALSALVLAFIIHRALPTPDSRTEAAEEWPPYRLPSLKPVLGQSMRQAGIFVKAAGSVILVISIILWSLGFMGPGTLEEREALDSSTRLEQSWLGSMGDFIEPAVRPLGYDGRMGIAIISSFAAREVFVGTMHTLYPTPEGSDGDGSIRALKERLANEVVPGTNRPLLNTASAASLIVFYMFAMQCVSTIVIVRRELNSWPWALAQALGYTFFAYIAALATYQILI
ncbi:MAG: ferrous iron transport protein B [Bacteroidetes bacterium]|nr:MAG: ferrous iron transport protein B [Bacteroidota bacterium]